uniref:Uncharacterized protein n=1 Tax=Romanomermis culicivorax TaxID=13658 RepID=A0A915K3G6_ROMCU
MKFRDLVNGVKSSLKNGKIKATEVFRLGGGEKQKLLLVNDLGIFRNLFFLTFFVKVVNSTFSVVVALDDDEDELWQLWLLLLLLWTSKMRPADDEVALYRKINSFRPIKINLYCPIGNCVSRFRRKWKNVWMFRMELWYCCGLHNGNIFKERRCEPPESTVLTELTCFLLAVSNVLQITPLLEDLKFSSVKTKAGLKLNYRMLLQQNTPHFALGCQESSLRRSFFSFLHQIRLSLSSPALQRFYANKKLNWTIYLQWFKTLRSDLSILHELSISEVMSYGISPC